MRWLLLAVVIALTVSTGCASGHPGNDLPDNDKALDSPLKLPRCMEYMSKWRGRGTVRELEVLEGMNNADLKDFLKDFETEP
jgi:anti-sigma factor ChrR (cupin superfamily)